MMAWRREAFIDIFITQGAGVSEFTGAREFVQSITTRSMDTRRTDALIEVQLTVGTSSSWQAAAPVAVHKIDAARAMLARRAHALVLLFLTTRPGVTRMALAAVAGDGVDAASVVTWVWFTLVYIHLT